MRYNLQDAFGTKDRISINESLTTYKSHQPETKMAIDARRVIQEASFNSINEFTKDILSGPEINLSAFFSFCKSQVNVVNITIEMIKKMVDNACREIKSDRNKYGTFIDTTKKCRKQFSEHSTQIITVNGFMFTSFKQPNVDYFNEFRKQFIDITQGKSIETIANKIKNQYDSDYKDDYRGYVLDTRSPIGPSDFDRELFKYFRNNGVYSDTIAFNAGNVIDIYNRFINELYTQNIKELADIMIKELEYCRNVLDKLSSGTVKTFTSLFNLLFPMDRQSSALLSKEVPDREIEPDELIKLQSIIKFKSEQLRFFCSISTDIMSSKITAIRQTIDMDIAVLSEFDAFIISTKGGNE